MGIIYTKFRISWEEGMRPGKSTNIDFQVVW